MGHVTHKLKTSRVLRGQSGAHRSLSPVIKLGLRNPRSPGKKEGHKHKSSRVASSPRDSVQCVAVCCSALQYVAVWKPSLRKARQHSQAGAVCDTEKIVCIRMNSQGTGISTALISQSCVRVCNMDLDGSGEEINAYIVLKRHILSWLYRFILFNKGIILEI